MAMRGLFLCVAAASAMVWGDFGAPALRPAAPSTHALAQPTAKTQGYVIREKFLSISGEDFAIATEEGRPAFEVVGSNKVPFGLGGFVLDKLELREAGSRRRLCGSIERRAVAVATAYDVYDGDGACVAKVEKDVVSLTPSYKWFYEAENNGDPYYRATGSFSQRRYDVYGRDGAEVATIGRQLVELLPDKADTYVVRCAEGADPAAILALALVIDEDHDETDAAKRARRESRKGDDGASPFGWFKGPLG